MRVSIVVLILSISSLTIAEPVIQSVSGSASNASSITISGSGFGSKVQASPRLFDSVDNQSAYSNLSEGQTIPAGGNNPYSINSFNDPGSVKYTENNNRHQYNTAHYKVSNGKGYMQWPKATGAEGGSPSSQRKLYVSYWFKPLASIPDEGHSSKFIRVWDDPNGGGTRISWTQMHLVYDGGSEVSWNTWGGQTNTWNRLELYVDADNNKIQAYTNSSRRHNVTDFVKRSASQGLNLARVGFDGGGVNPPNLSFDFGEVYVDVTQSRVEIGDASQWNNVSHKEIQLPTSWSGNSITFTVYQGSFNNLSGKYLYVVDAKGNVNSTGYPVCITNCGSGSKTPEPPTNLMGK